MTSRMLPRTTRPMAPLFHVTIPPRNVREIDPIWQHQPHDQHQSSKSSLFSATEVIDHLFLGGESDVNPAELSSRKIRFVLNLAEECDAVPSDSFTTKKIALKDHSDENIGAVLDEAVDAVHKALRKNDGVLVHCKLGISRSSTVVIAYLMKYGDGRKRTQMSYEEAFDHVKAHRPHISPNLGFILALHDFNARLEATRPLYLAGGAVVIAAPEALPFDFRFSIALTTPDSQLPLDRSFDGEEKLLDDSLLSSLDDLDDVFEEIEAHLFAFEQTQKPVLILCRPGVSSAASLLISFLLRFGQGCGDATMSLSQAFAFAAKNRSCKPKADWFLRVSNSGVYQAREVF